MTKSAMIRVYVKGGWNPEGCYASIGVIAKSGDPAFKPIKIQRKVKARSGTDANLHAVLRGLQLIHQKSWVGAVLCVSHPKVAETIFDVTRRALSGSILYEVRHWLAEHNEVPIQVSQANMDNDVMLGTRRLARESMRSQDSIFNGNEDRDAGPIDVEF